MYKSFYILLRIIRWKFICWDVVCELFYIIKVYLYFYFYYYFFLNFVEKNVSFFQNKVLCFFSMGEYRLFSLNRRFFMLSFFSRLKAVKELVFPRLCFFLSDFRKLQLTFSLRKKFVSRKFVSVYVPKVSGNSVIFDLPDVYARAYFFLFDLYSSPFLEESYNRYSYSSRPFRLYSDSFLFVKRNFFFSRISTNYYSIEDFLPLSDYSCFVSNSFMRDVFYFFNYRKILSTPYFHLVAHNSLFSLLNFSVIGLVRIFFIFFIFCVFEYNGRY